MLKQLKIEKMSTQNFRLILILLMVVSLQLQAQKTTKRVYKSFPLNQVTALELSNKYGNIQIDDNRKDSVVINVEIWVEGSSSRSQRLLDNISVNISSSGTTVSATTDFRNDFNNNNLEFSIDYVVSVPADRNLTVAQKYGNVNMNNLTGKGIFDIKYGELRGKNLLAPQLKMEIAYSKVNVDATKDLDLNIRYSKIALTKGENLHLDSRYSGLNIGECKEVAVESKYDDIRIKKVNSLTANSMYTGYKIDELQSALSFTNGYGDMSIGTIPASFRDIKVISRYATIRLGIDPAASYKLKGNSRYCDIKHPGGKLNRMKEDNSYEVEGVVGSAESPKSTVVIESSYGNVNLQQ